MAAPSSPPLTLDDFNLVYDEKYSALICRTCKNAVEPGQLARHFKRQVHQDSLYALPRGAPADASAAFRGKDITDKIPKLRDLILKLPDVKAPQELPRLLPTDPPHPLLHIHTGWLCSCGAAGVKDRLGADHEKACPVDGTIRPSLVQSWMDRGDWFPVRGNGPLLGHASGDGNGDVDGSSEDESEPVNSPAVDAFSQLLASTARESALDPDTLLPKQHTAATTESSTSSPWLGRVRWGVMLKDVPLSLASELVTDPSRLFDLLPVDPVSPLSAVELRKELISKVRAALIDAYTDLHDNGTDYIRSRLHCDDVDFAKSSQSPRPLRGDPTYIRTCSGVMAEVVALAWTLTVLKQGGAFEDAVEMEVPDSELMALRPLTESIASIESAMRRVTEHLREGTLESKHIGAALYKLLSQPVEGVGRSSVALLYSALKGIDPIANYSFRNGTAHSPFLSTLIFGLRLSIWAIALARTPRNDRGEAPELEANVDKLRISHAVSSKSCVLGKLYGDRNYALSCPPESSQSFRVIWTADSKAFTLNGETIRIKDFRRMAASMENEAIQLGLGLEYGPTASSSPSIQVNAAALRDVTGNKAVGYSFVSDRANVEVTSKLSTLICSRLALLIVKHRPRQGGPSAEDEGVELSLEKDKDEGDDKDEDEDEWSIDMDAVDQILKQEQTFLRSMFAAIFFTAGPANRGTELASVLIRNTPEQTRDVLLGPGGAVLLETAHSKTAWRAMYVDRVTRVLPVRLGFAFVRYLLGARPSMDRLRLLRYGIAAPAQLFVSPNGNAWDAGHLGDIVRLATQRHGLGVTLGLLGTRHCQAAICFRFMDRAILRRFISMRAAGVDKESGSAWEDGDERTTLQDPFLEREVQMGEALHRMSNHSLATASIHYQDNVDVRQGLGLDRQTISIIASSYWHRILELQTWSTAGQSPRRSIPAVLESAAGQERGDDALTPLANPQRQDMSTASQMGMATATATATSVVQHRPKNSALPLFVLATMAELCGRVVTCKAEGQARALNRLSRTKDSFVAILPTGAGKSLLWQTAARLAHEERQLIGLFVPLVALREDAKRAAEQCGLCTFSDTEVEVSEDVPANVEVLLG
ncbi:hypothetical protein OC861_006837, partial [Tilletia horrida]